MCFPASSAPASPATSAVFAVGPPIARFFTTAGSLSIEFCSDGSSAAFAPRSDIAVCSAMIWPASCSVAAR